MVFLDTCLFDRQLSDRGLAFHIPADHRPAVLQLLRTDFLHPIRSRHEVLHVSDHFFRDGLRRHLYDTMLVLDKIGRRNILIVGCFSQMLFMLVAAGLGTKSNKTDGDINGVVASLILFYVSEKVSLSVNAYVIGAEVGGTGLRKKSGCLSSSTCDKHLLQMQPCPLLPLWTLLLLLWSPSSCPTC